MNTGVRRRGPACGGRQAAKPPPYADPHTRADPGRAPRRTRAQEGPLARAAPPNPRKYSFGSPLLTTALLGYAGYGCQSLHNWYMEKTKEKGCADGITVRYKEEHFLHEPAPFGVGVDDLFDLFNLKALDASLLRCWTL